MEDKIILKFKTKNILNFYEIEPCCAVAHAYIALTGIGLYSSFAIASSKMNTCWRHCQLIPIYTKFLF